MASSHPSSPRDLMTSSLPLLTPRATVSLLGLPRSQAVRVCAAPRQHRLQGQGQGQRQAPHWAAHKRHRTVVLVLVVRLGGGGGAAGAAGANDGTPRAAAMRPCAPPRHALLFSQAAGQAQEDGARGSGGRQRLCAGAGAGPAEATQAQARHGRAAARAEPGQHAPHERLRLLPAEVSHVAYSPLPRKQPPFAFQAVPYRCPLRARHCLFFFGGPERTRSALCLRQGAATAHEG